MQNEVYREPSPNPEDQLCIHCKWYQNPVRSHGKDSYCLVVRDDKNLVTGESIVDHYLCNKQRSKYPICPDYYDFKKEKEKRLLEDQEKSQKEMRNVILVTSFIILLFLAFAFIVPSITG